jgi:hypothetical protein
MIDVSATVKMSHNLNGFLPSIFRSEPSGRSRKEEHAKEQNDGWDNLYTPWDAERSSALAKIGWSSINIGCSVLNEVLD